jgi:hypothetical protein
VKKPTKKQGEQAFVLLEELLDRWGDDIDDTDRAIDGGDAVEWMVEFALDAQRVVRRKGFKGPLSLD